MELDFILGAIVGIIASIVGGLFTLKTVELSWKKERVDKIYFPLISELNKLRIRVGNFHYDPSTPEWNKIKDQNMYHSIPKKLKEKLIHFFKVELHNYFVSIYACNNEIKKISKEELMKRKINKNDIRYIQEDSKRMPVEGYGPFNTLVDVGNMVLRRAKTGGYWGSAIDWTSLSKDYNRLKKHFKLEFETVEKYIEFLASKVKNHSLIKDTRKKNKKIIHSIDKLIKDLEKETTIKMFKIVKIKMMD